MVVVNWTNKTVKILEVGCEPFELEPHHAAKGFEGLPGLVVVSSTTENINVFDGIERVGLICV